MSCESSSTQSVSQSSLLLTASKSIQTPVSSNGMSSTPAVVGPSSSSQDQSAPGSTPLSTAAKRCSPLSGLLQIFVKLAQRHQALDALVSSLVMNACTF